MGPTERVLRDKLSAVLSPSHLELENESPKHGLAKEAEKHFRLVVVSESFHDLSRLERHRMVHQIVRDELAALVHAFSVQAYTPAEWKVKVPFASPDCAHPSS